MRMVMFSHPEEFCFRSSRNSLRNECTAPRWVRPSPSPSGCSSTDLAVHGDLGRAASFVRGGHSVARALVAHRNSRRAGFSFSPPPGFCWPSPSSSPPSSRLLVCFLPACSTLPMQLASISFSRCKLLDIFLPVAAAQFARNLLVGTVTVMARLVSIRAASASFFGVERTLHGADPPRPAPRRARAAGLSWKPGALMRPRATASAIHSSYTRLAEAVHQPRPGASCTPPTLPAARRGWRSRIAVELLHAAPRRAAPAPLPTIRHMVFTNVSNPAVGTFGLPNLTFLVRDRGAYTGPGPISYSLALVG